MTGSILFYIGTAVLALVIAYGIYRWSQFKRTATPADLAVRDQATRENFDKVETGHGVGATPVETPTGPAPMRPTPLGMAPTPLAPAPPDVGEPVETPVPVENPPPAAESWPRPVETHPGADPRTPAGARRKGAKPKPGPNETRPNS